MTDKKNKKDLDNTGPEPVFNIHRMPKNYKSGRFEIASNDGETKVQPTKQHKQKNKKIGLFIIVFGCFFVLFLGYLVFSYISKPDFSFNNIFNLKSNSELVDKNNKTDNPFEESKDKGKEDSAQDKKPTPEENLEGDNKGGESVEDLEEDNQGEQFVEDIKEEDSEETVPYIFIDTDEDGLSDEEEALLGSDHLKIDSDDDGHEDLLEVLSLYDPSSFGKLIDNDNITEFKSDFFGYSLLYPISWDKSALSDESSVVFLINESSFIQILVEKNEGQQNIGNWYSSRFFNSVDKDKIIIKDDYQGLYSEDGLVFYLMDKDLKNVYTLLYNFPDSQEPSYINIFKMMVNSFKLK